LDTERQADGCHDGIDDDHSDRQALAQVDLSRGGSRGHQSKHRGLGENLKRNDYFDQVA
jgi:hypothetical protein